MPTLSEVLAGRAGLSPADADWLRRLVGDWQMLADLSFADLTLWVPTDGGEGRSWVLAAHARPTTGPNFYDEDIVGRVPAPPRRDVLTRTYQGERVPWPYPGAMTRRGEVAEDHVPVVRGDITVAVLCRHTDLTHRQRGGLEVNYLHMAAALMRMVAEGAFPTTGPPTGIGHGTPRVGDGVVRLLGDGVIDYASPNAVSALRRLGHTDHVVGADLSEIVTSLLPYGVQMDETMPLVLTGRAPWHTEIDAAGINLTMRAVPLTERGQRIGAILLTRDVTELRRRERELLSKDAMIREIHHRVKNNLQTVAALLRLQSRRMPDSSAQVALQEAGRRIATVAMVHDTLSQELDETVDFDQIAVRIARATVDVTGHTLRPSTRHSGSFGRLRAEDATPLAMILAELVSNAVEHGFAEDAWRGVSSQGEVPSVQIAAGRRLENGEDVLTVSVRDNGIGLPHPDHRRRGLGTQIVLGLINDVRGSIRWEAESPHGTCAQFDARPRPLRSEPGVDPAGVGEAEERERPQGVPDPEVPDEVSGTPLA